MEIPAGFTVVTENGINGQEFFYCEGPKATAGQITVESFWDQPGGISFHITNDRHLDNGIFNREELGSLGRLIEQVNSKISYAAAHDYFAQHPEHFEKAIGVVELAVLADAQGLSAPEAFQAYMDIYGKSGDDNA
ncbi:hypothetical protein [Glutamicibacter sp.]|uniref:hypothetical protein n=1 Tax=Glutamicibacter sp. TaxID=1931995 RepID=UPI002FE0D9C2